MIPISETATKEEIYAAYDTSAYNCYITGKYKIFYSGRF